MMPSVGDGSVPLRHHDPAIRLTAAGFGGLYALWLASARPAGQRQQCSVRERTPVLSAESPNTISRSLAPGLVKGTRSAAARRATSSGGARWQRSRRPGAAPVCGCRSVHHSYRPVLARRARRILVKQLTELGYEVLQAADASDALEVLGTERKIDLLLTDIVTARGCERLGTRPACRPPATGIEVAV
jgi:hypothetical protein